MASLFVIHILGKFVAFFPPGAVAITESEHTLVLGFNGILAAL
jgi:hypothetical protein